MTEPRKPDIFDFLKCSPECSCSKIAAAAERAGARPTLVPQPTREAHHHVEIGEDGQPQGVFLPFPADEVDPDPEWQAGADDAHIDRLQRFAEAGGWDVGHG